MRERESHQANLTDEARDWIEKHEFHRGYHGRRVIRQHGSVVGRCYSMDQHIDVYVDYISVEVLRIVQKVNSEEDLRNLCGIYDQTQLSDAIMEMSQIGHGWDEYIPRDQMLEVLLKFVDWESPVWTPKLFKTLLKTVVLPCKGINNDGKMGVYSRDFKKFIDTFCDKVL